jgi:NAD(P)-dependent dehydrogenase (short-subunit alcohol dehydrogenase family)
MRLLVTGGAGYIGSVVVAQLLAEGHQVTVLDDLSTGHRDAVPDGAAFVAGRVHDAAAQVLAGGGYHGVLHFAASALVAESVADPYRYWENNVVGALRLLAAMREAGVPRLVFSSTCATYGAPARTPITEDTLTQPINPYGQSKLAVDHLLSGWAPTHGLAAVSLRYFNVGGAHTPAPANPTTRRPTSSRTCWRCRSGSAPWWRSTAPTTPPGTAPRSATTCMWPTSAGHTCSRWPRRRPGTGSTTSAPGPGTPCARCSTPAAGSPAGRSRPPTDRAGRATRRPWSPPATGSPRS